jgi:hypothetical protein
MQQVRAWPHPELQRAGVGQARQAHGRNEAAEPRGVRVDRLKVAAGDPGADPGEHRVGAHHHIGIEDGARGATNPEGLAAFFEGVYPAAQVQVPGPPGAGQQLLQTGAVQPVKRGAEGSRVPAAHRVHGDRVPVTAVAVDNRGRLGRGRRQVIAQAQVLQHPGGVGGQRDRRAGLPQLGGLLNHLGGYATASSTPGRLTSSTGGSGRSAR